MYQLDININTAVERQADRVRAVNAYSSRQTAHQSAPSWAEDGATQPNRIAGRVTLALAVAAPVVTLMVWGLLAH